jgi:hypothetical protein
MRILKLITNPPHPHRNILSAGMWFDVHDFNIERIPAPMFLLSNDYSLELIIRYRDRFFVRYNAMAVLKQQVGQA